MGEIEKLVTEHLHDCYDLARIIRENPQHPCKLVVTFEILGVFENYIFSGVIQVFFKLIGLGFFGSA